MNRAWLPWLLTLGCVVALTLILVLDATRTAAPAPTRADRLAPRIDELERQVAELREEVHGLRAGVPEEPPSRTIDVRPRIDSASAPAADPTKRSEAPPRFGPLTQRHAYARARAWCDAIRRLDDADARTRAFSEIREAFRSDDDGTLLAGLLAARWSFATRHDRDGWRALILPHVSSREPALRRAALEALLVVKPDPADLTFWIEEAESADRQNAETTASSLVLLADGRVEGATADAVLRLLRPGTDIKAAFVIRGLRSAKVLDARVRARLLEIVRNAPPGDYDSHYFFHFVARHLTPKSDALVDLILDRAAGGQGQLDTILSGLEKGLNDRQRSGAADRLVGLAENAGTDWARATVLKVLVTLAGPAQVARLDAIATDPDVNESARELAKTAAKAARARN